MTSLYDVLKAIATGRAPDLFTALMAKQAQKQQTKGGGEGEKRDPEKDKGA